MWWVLVGVVVLDFLLYLVVYGFVLCYIGYVDDKMKVRVDVGVLYFDEGFYVLVGLMDVGEVGFDELVGDGVNVVYVWVRVSFYFFVCGIIVKIWMFGRGGWGRRRWWWFEFMNL